MNCCTAKAARTEQALRRRGAVLAGRLPTISLDRSPATVAHEFAALGLYVGGRARFELGGTVWSVECGDVVVMPAGEPHRPVDVQTPDIWGLGFHPAVFTPEARGVLLESFERVRAGASPVVRLAASRQTLLETLFRELTKASPVPGGNLVEQSVLTLVLNEIAQSTGWSAPATRSGGVVSRSLRFIERHCLGPLTLHEVAAAVDRTPSYVTAALSRATGRSAVQWIIAGRLAEARRCLLHSDETIEDIAVRVGYADATHFIRLFRRAHDMTPTAWRLLQRAPHPRARIGTGEIDHVPRRRGGMQNHVT
jgi:AraC-like DNA-binding protein